MISERQAVDDIIASEEQYFQDLAKVTTIPEVMKMYDIKYHTTVSYAIDRGDITAVLVGGVWIVSLDSVIAYYGKPDLEAIA